MKTEKLWQPILLLLLSTVFFFYELIRVKPYDVFGLAFSLFFIIISIFLLYDLKKEFKHVRTSVSNIGKNQKN